MHSHADTHTSVMLINHSHCCKLVAEGMNKKLHLLIKERTDTYTDEHRRPSAPVLDFIIWPKGMSAR